MDGMIYRALLICLVFAIAPSLFAQNEEAAARQREAAEIALRAQQERAAAEAERRAREESILRMREFMRDTSVDIRSAVERSEVLRQVERRRKAERFQEALNEFAAANEDYRQSIGFGRSLKDLAKKWEKQTGVFLEFVRGMTDRRAKLDTSEFNGARRSELEWEALTTAERLLPRLSAVVGNEGETTVDVKYFDSLATVENDLLRLQWLTRRLK
jgi:hypothetical protein